jgi:hypothetical protein
MKEIPCHRCGREALGPPTPANPGGEPIRFSRFTGENRPIVFKCYRCGDSLKVDALAFHSLPDVE